MNGRRTQDPVLLHCPDMTHAYSRWLAPLVLLCSIPIAACNGVGSRPRGENTAPRSTGEITMTGCIDIGGNTVRFRETDSVGLAGREPAQVGNPDSSGGSLTHLAPAATAGNGSSTTANGAWNGSRGYTLAADDRVREMAGRFVRVTGTVEAVEAEPAGTDQMQTVRGAVLPQLRVASVTPLDGTCAGPRANTSDVEHHDAPPAAAGEPGH